MDARQLEQLVDASTEEWLNILTSMKGLLILSEHYANPPETVNYLGMLSTCISRMETSVLHARSQVRGEGSQD